MISPDLLAELSACLRERRIGAGIALLREQRQSFQTLKPGDPHAGMAIACLAQWVDVGYAGEEVFMSALEGFGKGARQMLPLREYVHLRLAEALAAMRREEAGQALDHLGVVLSLSGETEDAELPLTATLWKARCLRKAGDYEQALAITRQGMDLAAQQSAWQFKALMQTLESWILFQNGEPQEAIRILQEAEAVLRATDDFITLGNIQSAYGRIALREGRYDHAMRYFEASIDYFKRQNSLEGYLARSLTNIAQAKRLLALQLRRTIDARWERQRRNTEAAQAVPAKNKAAQLERMHELLQSAQTDLTEADRIYKSAQNHHGAGNVDVNLADIYLDLGDLERAEEKATEAYDLGATKADYVLMCRARIVMASVANARYDEEMSEGDDPSHFAQLAHDCAKEAVDLGERTESRRLLAQAYICRGLTLVNGFFNDAGAARVCCDSAESYLGHDHHDSLWQEVEFLRQRILHGGIEDPNLRAWSQGAVGDKSLGDVVGQFEELLIRKVWEHEGRKVSRVARKLAVSPKKVRRVLRHLGMLSERT